MSPTLRAALIAALVSARTALDGALHLLEYEPGPAPDFIDDNNPDADACPHDIEDRIDLSTFTSNKGSWKCGAVGCGYTHKPEKDE